MDSFEKGLGEYYKRLMSFAMSLTHNHARAEDLTQETMLRALTNREKFTPGTNLLAWLFTIMKHKLFSEHRRSKTERAYLDFKQLHASHEMDPGQEAAMERTEVMEAIELLPPDQREIVRLIGIEGHSYDSAALITGNVVGTVKSRLSRSRGKLVERLSNDRVTHGARRVVQNHREGAVLTLYGERFELSETVLVAQPDLHLSAVKIFRSI